MNVRLSTAEIAAMRNAELFTDNNAMYQLAPSLFARSPHPKMSDKYGFTNTYDILLHMHNKGFKVVAVHGGDRRYKKVLIRMRSTHHDEREGVKPELVVLDSHDGTSRLRMCLGAITGVCLNGMIAGDMMYSKAYVHRSPDLMARVMLDLLDIDMHIDRLIQRIADMRAYQVTPMQRMMLADAVVRERWGKETCKDESFVLDMRQQLVRTRRVDDQSSDMYTVMNVIQENALRGGASYVTSNNRLNTVRPISDVRRNLHINQCVWNKAEELMKEAA